MENTIENLNINVKFDDNLGDAAKRLEELADSITKVNDAAGKTSAISRMSKNVKALNDSTSKLKTSSTFREIGKSTQAASNSTKSFTQSTSTAIVKVAVFMRALKTLGKTIFTGVSDLNNLALGIKHMNNLFGEGADEVIAYAREVETLMGIPMADFLSTQGAFGNMMAGFGVSSKNVRSMSQGLTQLSHDLEAFNTIGAEQSEIVGMLQSGLSGYDKSLRKFGYALREVELQEILHRNGLDMKVSQLNRAGKSQLVYMAIMEQSAKMGVFGSLAKQTTSPIVAFNILKNQVRLLAQTLASVLLPVIIHTMKYLQAFAMAISNVILKLAALFGIKITPLDFGQGNSGQVYDYADGIGALGDQAGGATKKLKALKEQMAGFDKLNVMKQEAPSTPSVGGIGGPDLGGLDLPIPEYGDFLGDMLEDVRELSKVLEPVVAILAAIAGFTIISWLANIPVIAAFLAPVWELLGLWRLWITEVGLVSGTLELLSAAFGLLTTPIALTIAAIVAIVVAIKQLWEENKRFRDNVVTTWEGIKGIVSSVWEKVLKPIFEMISVQIMFIVDYALVPLWEKFKMVFESISNLVMTVWNEALGPIVKWLVDTFGFILPVIFGLFSGAFTIAFATVSKIFEVTMWVLSKGIDGITIVFKGIIDFLKGTFSGGWKEAWEGVKQIFSSIVGTFFGIFKKAWDGIMGLFSKGGKIFTGMVTGIANLFRTVVNSIISGMNRAISIPFNAINRMLNTIRDVGFLGIKPFSKLWGHNPIGVPRIPTLPSYDVGTAHVTHDHVAQIHQGEAIIPKKFNDKKYFGKSDDEETKRLLKEANVLLARILEKDSTVRVSSSDIETAGNGYRRMVVKSRGGL